MMPPEQKCDYTDICRKAEGSSDSECYRGRFGIEVGNRRERTHSLGMSQFVILHISALLSVKLMNNSSLNSQKTLLHISFCFSEKEATLPTMGYHKSKCDWYK